MTATAGSPMTANSVSPMTATAGSPMTANGSEPDDGDRREPDDGEPSGEPMTRRQAHMTANIVSPLSVNVHIFSTRSASTGP